MHGQDLFLNLYLYVPQKRLAGVVSREIVHDAA